MVSPNLVQTNIIFILYFIFLFNLRLLLMPLNHFDIAFGSMNALNSNDKSLILILHTCYPLRIGHDYSLRLTITVFEFESECGCIN